MRQLFAVTLLTLLSSGCAAAGPRGAMYRPPAPAFPDDRPNPNAPRDLSSPEGSPTPAVEPTPTFDSAPAGEEGPTLLAPEAKRRGTASIRTAQLQAPRPRSAVGKPKTDRSITNVAWSNYFRSTDRRPIESTILGQGPTKIAIIGSLHGDEPQSIALVDLLAKHLKDHPELLEGRSVLIVRNPNPDGLFARTPHNSRGVNLNSNFPAPNWKEVSGGRSGANAASEVETRTLMRMLLEFEPKLVVHVKDYAKGRFVNVDGPARTSAERLSEAVDAELLEGLGARTTGSLEAFATSKLNSAAITALLNDAGSPDDAWREYGKGLVALLEAAPSANPARPTASTGEPSEERSTEDFAPNIEEGTPLEEANDDANIETDRASQADRKKPAGRSTSPNASPSAKTADKPQAPAILEDDADVIARPKHLGPVPAKGYYELPAPPGQ
jgi:hypothetical protein